MKRPVLIALAVALPIAVFGAAKIAASWRPVAVGKIARSQKRYQLALVRASERYVVAGVLNHNAYTLFDLETGAQRRISHQSIVEDGSQMIQIRGTQQVDLVVAEPDGRQSSYRLPNFSMSSSTEGFEIEKTALQTVRVSAAAQHVELVLSSNYYRWNKSSRQLERSFPLYDVKSGGFNGFIGDEVAAISRDSEHVAVCDSDAIEWRSTQDGKIIRRSILRGQAPPDAQLIPLRISAYGSYVLYAVQGAGAPAFQVRSTQSGRLLWSFPYNDGAERFFFSPDERWLALLSPARGHWEIRAVATGEIIRTLPIVSATKLYQGAFSPDGATLYSVANGTLYRQRAR